MFVAVGYSTYAVVNWEDIGSAILQEENPKQLVDPFFYQRQLILLV